MGHKRFHMSEGIAFPESAHIVCMQYTTRQLMESMSFTTADINPYCDAPGYISYFKNGVDPDQLTSEKPADLDPHCIPPCF